MSARSFSLPIEKVYAQLRNILQNSKCEITEEKPPKYISIRQGSLNGILPRSVKKSVKYYLSPEGAGTRITSSTQIASDWTNLTLFGNILAAFLAGIFLWISVDMQHYMQTSQSGFWTWLASFHVYPDLLHTMFMISLTRATAIFLALAIIAEILIVVYVCPRKDAFAQETLQAIR